MKHPRTCSIVGALIASLSAGTAFCQTPAEFYGRTVIRLIVSADPGGSYDTDSRLLARHLGRHIAGNPKIIAENMMGASGRVAANYM